MESLAILREYAYEPPGADFDCRRTLTMAYVIGEDGPDAFIKLKDPYSATSKNLSQRRRGAEKLASIVQLCILSTSA
jgi:hypothetical protein